MSLEEHASSHRVTAGLVRGIIWVFFATAALVGIANLVFGTIAVVNTLVSGQVPLNLVSDHPLPPNADAGDAKVVSGNYEIASVVLSHLSSGTVALATVSSIAGILTSVALSVLVALLSWQLLHRPLFRRSLSLAATFGGSILLVGGMLAQGAGSLATGTAALELNGSDPQGIWPLAGRFDPTFIGVGVVLMLVGLAFEYGEKLQRETEGLI